MMQDLFHKLGDSITNGIQESIFTFKQIIYIGVKEHITYMDCKAADRAKTGRPKTPELHACNVLSSKLSMKPK